MGRELHLGVAVPSIRSTDGVRKIKFGKDVPPVITTYALTPAGSHRGHAVVERLISANHAGHCKDVIADPGYSLLAEGFLEPLLRQNIDVTFRPVTHQRGARAFGDGWEIEGFVYSRYTPQHLMQLEPPPRGATADERQPYIDAHNERARWRMGRNGKPKDGVIRLRSPFDTGKLRSRQLPASIRGPRSAPLVELPPDATPESTITVGINELVQRQPTVPFSDAWHESYGRRNLSETANSYLQGSFVNIEEKYARFLTTAKIESWLVYTIAEANRRIVSNFLDFQRDKDTVRIRRPRRDRATRISDLKTHPSPTSRPRPANGKSPPG